MPFKTASYQGIGNPSMTGLQPGTPDDTAKVPVGTIAKFYDDTQGEGEFIYLPGLAATVTGDCVVYDLLPAGQATVRLVTNTFNNTGRPVAVAMGATLATQFGWYQIGGCGIVNTVAATVAGAAFANATTGQLSNTADAGDQLLGARISSAVGTPAAGKSYVTLSRPCMQSQIT